MCLYLNLSGNHGYARGNVTRTTTCYVLVCVCAPTIIGLRCSEIFGQQYIRCSCMKETAFTLCVVIAFLAQVKERCSDVPPRSMSKKFIKRESGRFSF